ncbi:MAG: tetratricopeptide repeat protein [Candidatus Thorarchaeota archaeon]
MTDPTPEQIQAELMQFTQALTRVCEDEPTTARDWGLRASTNLMLQNFPEAERSILKSIELDPDFSGAYLTLSLVYSATQRMVEAEEAVQKAIELDPENPRAWGFLGDLKEEKGQIGIAQDLLKESVHLGEDKLTLKSLARTYIKDKQYVKAIEILRKLEKLTPQDPDMWVMVGICNSGLGEHKRAEAVFKGILDVDKNHANAWLNLGGTLLVTGRFDEAEKALRRHVELDRGSVNGWNNLGFIMFKTLRPKGAERCWRRVLKLDPENLDAWVNLGSLFLEIGEFDRAEKHYNQALTIDPLCNDAVKGHDLVRKKRSKNNGGIQ